MRHILLLAVLCFIATPVSLEGQMRRGAPPPANWVNAYGTMYTGLSSFYDPGTESDWVFDEPAFGFGLGLQRDFGGLLMGIDASLARPAYERRPRVGIGVASGTASVATAMATGRFGYGGATDLGFYLSGGAGTIAYNLEDEGAPGWNADFALRAGTGLEYRMSPSRAVYLEWGRIWGYHEREGIGGGAVQHSILQLGMRFGL
jgi:hypothetical protein